jgi:hypothetical protein
MKRVVCLLVVAGAVLAAVGLQSAGASPEDESRQRRCAVEGADIVDGGATYDEATSTLTFQMTTGGATCLGQRYRLTVYDDEDPASVPLSTAVVRGDGVTENPDLTDFVVFTFNGVPAGDLIFCFVGKTSAAYLFDRAPDVGRFCFDVSGGGSGSQAFR